MAITQLDFYDFLNTYGFNDLRQNALIDSIVDNNNYTYTINTLDTSNLISEQAITIPLSSIFTKEYRIDNIVENTSFDIVNCYDEENGLQQIEIGLSILETGLSWLAKSPVFIYDEIENLNVRFDRIANSVSNVPLVGVAETPNLRFKQTFQNDKQTGYYDLEVSGIEMFFLTLYKNDWEREDFNSVFSEMELLLLEFRRNLIVNYNNSRPVENSIVSISEIQFNKMQQISIQGDGEDFDKQLCGIVTDSFTITISKAGYAC